MTLRLSLAALLFGVFAATSGTPEFASAEVALLDSFDQPDAVQDAPQIVLHQPRDGGVYASPLGIDVGFHSAVGAAIDLSTLKVTVMTRTLVGDLTFDITSDVSRYASASGIHVLDADVPAGEHTVTISVADSEQRKAERRLTITVRADGARGVAD